MLLLINPQSVGSMLQSTSVISLCFKHHIFLIKIHRKRFLPVDHSLKKSFVCLYRQIINVSYFIFNREYVLVNFNNMSITLSCELFTKVRAWKFGHTEVINAFQQCRKVLNRVNFSCNNAFLLIFYLFNFYPWVFS